MMNQLSVATIVILGLVGSAHMQTSNQQAGLLQPVGDLVNSLPVDNLLGGVLGGQQPGQMSMNGGQQQQGPANPLNSLLGSVSSLLQQQPGNGVGNLLGGLGVNLQQQPGNELGNLLGGLGLNLQPQQQQQLLQQQQQSPQMQGNGGNGDINNSRLFNFLRQLPQQGMKMISDLLSGARNLLPGLGRNQQSPWNQPRGQNSNQNPNQSSFQNSFQNPDQTMTSPASNELTNSGNPTGAESRTSNMDQAKSAYNTVLPSGNYPTNNRYPNY